MIKKIIKEIRLEIRDFLVNRKERARLTNSNFSIISSDCTGGCMYHDLREQFMSPTINMFFCATDYIKFLKKLDHYVLCEIKDAGISDEGYPRGKLDDIELELVHYKSVEDANIMWQRRAKRINRDNIILVFNDRNGCSIQHIKEFDALPYKRKVCFTHVPYPDIKSVFYIPGCEEQEMIGTVTGWNGYRRRYDVFDYVHFINTGEIRSK